jgi:diacylglycerol kinase
LKNSSIWSRAKNSVAGLRHGWQRERSFRTQASLVAAAAIAIIFYVAPAPIWIGLFLLSAVVGVAFELLNAALEALADKLHPAHHAEIGEAKDMASAAAFVANCFTAILFAWLVFSSFAD